MSINKHGFLSFENKDIADSSNPLRVAKSGEVIRMGPVDKTILVVDDDDLLRGALAADFKRKGFNVLTAECGSAAFALILQTPIDLVISDIRMPNGDGLQLLSQIRQKDAHQPIVILLTGYSDVTDKQCSALGARQVIAKPFERRFLMKSVFEALGIPLPTA